VLVLKSLQMLVYWCKPCGSSFINNIYWLASARR